MISLIIMAAVLGHSSSASAGPQARSSISQQRSSEVNSLARSRFNVTGTHVGSMALSGGVRLTVSSPMALTKVLNEATDVLRNAHRELTATLGPIPAFQLKFRLLDSEQFYADTNAPYWTNALYYRNEILVPINQEESYSRDALARSIRHEYFHAVTNVLSNGKCPGWLDEGLAQMIEGSVNPLLIRALRDWLTKNRPLSFSILQGGFTRLPSERVAAAYAQSLFAAKLLWEDEGPSRFRTFLDLLKAGHQSDQAFFGAYRMTEKEFELRMSRKLLEWKSSGGRKLKSLRAGNRS